MIGRWAVWPTMFSLFLAMVSVTWVAEALLYLGLAMTLARDGPLRARRCPSALREGSTSGVDSPDRHAPD